MVGILHLKSGLAASRLGDDSTSDDHLTKARDLTRHITPDSDHYHLTFDQNSINI